MAVQNLIMSFENLLRSHVNSMVAQHRENIFICEALF